MGASKRWTYYPEAARLLIERGLDVWVVGGPGEKALAQEIVAAGGPKTLKADTKITDKVLSEFTPGQWRQIGIKNDKRMAENAGSFLSFSSHLQFGETQYPRGTPLPQRMLVDYVRVYDKVGGYGPTPPRGPGVMPWEPGHVAERRT